jgi:hypothetical protein
MAFFPVLVYAAIIVAFAGLTISEGIKKKASWDFYRIIGVVACVAWPAVLLLAMREVYINKKSSHQFDKRTL